MTHKINLAFSLSFGYSIFNEEYSQLPQSKLMHAYNLVMRVRKEEKMGEGTKRKRINLFSVLRKDSGSTTRFYYMEGKLAISSLDPDIINSPGTVQHPY